MAYFSGRGLFSEEKSDAKWLDASIHPANIIAEVYDSALQSALMRAEGKQIEADYLLDCGYFDYYYRCLQYKKYCDTVKAQVDAGKNKTE